MDIQEARFQACVESIGRVRWFVLVTTLLSSLLLFHMYLEQFSQEAANLEGAIANRIRKGIESKMNCLSKAMLQVVPTKLDELVIPKLSSECRETLKELKEAKADRLIEEYAQLRFVFDRTWNTLKDFKSKDRTLVLPRLRGHLG